MELFGVLVTYQRLDALEYSLLHIDRQSPVRLKKLVVVDNQPSEAAEDLVSECRRRGLPVTYLPSEENVGLAAGRARGADHLLNEAADDDWIMFFDDRRALPTPTMLSALADFAEEMYNRDPMTAGIALAGARVDVPRARITMPSDDEFTGPIAVDCLYGNRFLTYRVAAIRTVGTFDPRFFWGWEDTEYNIRLREAGYSLYMHGRLWKEVRSLVSTPGFQKVHYRLDEPDSRRYYSLRNGIRILLERRHYGTAARVALVGGLAKPLVNLPITPRLAVAHLRLNIRAIHHGVTGRMGRTLEMNARSLPLSHV